MCFERWKGERERERERGREKGKGIYVYCKVRELEEGRPSLVLVGV